MIQCINSKHLSGQKIIDAFNSDSNPEVFQDFLQSELECDEIYFLQHLAKQIVEDHANSKVPFENQSAKEFADYVRQQSHLFPAKMFEEEEIDGGKYCEQDKGFLLKFFRQKCGFRAGTATSLIVNIDKYPLEPSAALTSSKST